MLEDFPEKSEQVELSAIGETIEPPSETDPTTAPKIVPRYVLAHNFYTTIIRQLD